MLRTGARRAWGGIEAPGTLVGTRFPSVVTSVVPVCVVKGVSAPPCVSGAVTSVSKCVLSSTPGMNEPPRASVPACVSGIVCVKETARVSEWPSVRGTVCVRSLCVRELMVGMREHAAASPGVSVMEWCVSVVIRRCAWMEWRRRRRRQMRDKDRVAAVAILGTVPGWHGGKREVRAVPGTRLPRARLRE